MFAGLPELAQERKPNVVFMLVDNVGWGTFGAYGGTVPTPRIDELAKQGIRFNNYNVEVLCTPMRRTLKRTTVAAICAPKPDSASFGASYSGTAENGGAVRFDWTLAAGTLTAERDACSIAALSKVLGDTVRRGASQ